MDFHDNDSLEISIRKINFFNFTQEFTYDFGFKNIGYYLIDGISHGYSGSEGLPIEPDVLEVLSIDTEGDLDSQYFDLTTRLPLPTLPEGYMLRDDIPKAETPATGSLPSRVGSLRYPLAANSTPGPINFNLDLVREISIYNRTRSTIRISMQAGNAFGINLPGGQVYHSTFPFAGPNAQKALDGRFRLTFTGSVGPSLSGNVPEVSIIYKVY